MEPESSLPYSQVPATCPYTTQEHSTKNTKHSKYKYTYYPTHYTHYTHSLQNKFQQPQYKVHTKQNSHSKGKGHPCTGIETLYRPYGP